ncbi:hypothetical protein [Streptomyces sp. DSM 118148]|uniref:hypothetical protein n=1 Tax=Streptomyces sp. DSM 118148 TaxID=3448667 RepID=UPI00404018B0
MTGTGRLLPWREPTGAGRGPPGVVQRRRNQGAEDGAPAVVAETAVLGAVGSVLGVPLGIGA